MQHDDRGLAMTAANAEAARRTTDGMRAYVTWRTDALAQLELAIAADPGCVLAYAAKGLALTTGRAARFRPMIADSLEKAKAAADGATSRERHYVAALEALHRRRPLEAVVAYEAILAEAPTDIFALRLAQQELFWMGEAAWMRDLAVRVGPAWSDAVPDHASYLAVRAFGHEEAGEHETAERAGRASVERDPGECWGAHAVAHVMEMQGRDDEGIAWLDRLAGGWEGRNQIVHHLWWHRCLYHLERGEHDAALAFYDTHVRNPDSPLVKAMPDAYIDLQNAAALLIRFELRGASVGDRWQALADPAVSRIDDPSSPFTSAHAAAIFAAAGRYAEADSLIAAMRAFSAADDGPLGIAFRSAALPAAEAAVAHRRGDHGDVVQALLPHRRHLARMGASHAQRDLFWQVLLDSVVRLGDGTLAGRLLDEIAAIGFHRARERSGYQAAARLAA